MSKNIRQNQGFQVYDPSAIDNLEFNAAAGSHKISEVGRHLLPIPYVSGGSVAYTTQANAAPVILPILGTNLAVYNNSGSLASLTLGEDNTITSLAAGTTDASGHVGIPLAPNSWTYIASASQQWVITSAATVLVFMIDDTTGIKQEAAR